MKKPFAIAFLIPVIFLAGCCKDDNNPIPPSVSIHSGDIAMSELLDLGKTVAFYYESTQEITQGVWTLEVPTESGETVVIFTHELDGIGFTVVTPDNIEFIPDREDYLRTTSGMLDARVRLAGTFANGALAGGEYAVELPYRPSKPTLEVCRIENDDFEKWESDVTVCFSSFGAMRYLLKERPTLGSSSITNYGVRADNYEFTLPAVYMDTEHEIKVIAYNDYGSVESDPIYVGGDPDYYMNSTNPANSKAYRDPITNEVISLDVEMHTTSTADDLILYFTKGKTEFAQLELPVVEIINIGTGSTITQVQNYSSGSAINTSHLPQGVYIVAATDNAGKVHRAKFVKK